MSEIDDLIRARLPSIARRMQNELILASPVSDGQLRSSIRVVPSSNGLTIIMAEHGKFVEFGCFYKDTVLIKTKKGNKKLKDLKVGELIWTGKEYKKLIQKEKLEIGYSIRKVIIKTKNKR